MQPSSPTSQTAKVISFADYSQSSAHAFIIVPPFLKHFGGPLAGPAYLKGAGEKAGHSVRVLDLNHEWILQDLPTFDSLGAIRGDHDKPSLLLAKLHAKWLSLCAKSWPGKIHRKDLESKLVQLKASHSDVYKAASNLSRGKFGSWVTAVLRKMPPPDVVGISIMFSGQVLAALATSQIVRQIWPEIKIVWGGPHVTALAEEIGRDPEYGRYVDGFVTGYAEKTWTELLDSVAKQSLWPPEVWVAGSCPIRAKDDPASVPKFDLPVSHVGRITLPLQSSRGCSYGRCTYCTYPKIEGGYRLLSASALEETIAEASRLGAVISFKDSLIPPSQLTLLAEQIKGRVEWSACTKLHVMLNVEKLQHLHRNGCRTLEVGLETLDTNSQRLIKKEQSHGLFLAFLDAADQAGIAVVVNYITDLPHTDLNSEAVWLRSVKRELAIRRSLVSKLEINSFQLERLSPMGGSPEDYGLRVTRSWPWSSLFEFEIIPSSAQPRIG